MKKYLIQNLEIVSKIELPCSVTISRFRELLEDPDRLNKAHVQERFRFMLKQLTLWSVVYLDSAVVIYGFEIYIA